MKIVIVIIFFLGAVWDVKAREIYFSLKMLHTAGAAIYALFGGLALVAETAHQLLLSKSSTKFDLFVLEASSNTIRVLPYFSNDSLKAIEQKLGAKILYNTKLWNDNTLHICLSQFRTNKIIYRIGTHGHTETFVSRNCDNVTVSDYSYDERIVFNSSKNINTESHNIIKIPCLLADFLVTGQNSNTFTTHIEFHLLGPHSGTPLFGAQHVLRKYNFAPYIAFREPTQNSLDIYRKELKCLYVFASGLSTLKKCKGISLEGFVKAMKTNLPNADFSFPCILDDRMLKYGQAGEKIKKFEKSYEIIPSENIRKKLGNSGMMWLASNAQNLLTHYGTHWTDSIIEVRETKGLNTFIVKCNNTMVSVEKETFCRSKLHRRGFCIQGNHRESDFKEASFSSCFSTQRR
jgi:hypothetical protein